MHNVNNKKQKLISKEQDETSVQQYIIATFKTPENMKVVKKKKKKDLLASARIPKSMVTYQLIIAII
jgi:hypothetical protein